MFRSWPLLSYSFCRRLTQDCLTFRESGPGPVRVPSVNILTTNSTPLHTRLIPGRSSPQTGTEKHQKKILIFTFPSLWYIQSKSETKNVETPGLDLRRKNAISPGWVSETKLFDANLRERGKVMAVKIRPIARDNPYIFKNDFITYRI